MGSIGGRWVEGPGDLGGLFNLCVSMIPCSFCKQVHESNLGTKIMSLSSKTGVTALFRDTIHSFLLSDECLSGKD